ncbi:MAG: hypothetical protein JWQ06_320, partial [Mucilaginibacter sp.]|nr:hypothetical protein [Mucilaginibacter sp.]
MSLDETKLQDLRQSFSALHASDHPSVVEALNTLKENVVTYSGNTFYEELQSVSYNPDFQTLEAIFVMKQAFGYNGNLCTNGSFAFVRFYLDYGSGWEDQGYTGVNEHDIPTGTDCNKNPEKPLSYSASLKIAPKTAFCRVHILPKVRAILEWNKIPPANDPNYNSIWGDRVDDFIQIRPIKEIIFKNPHLSQLVELAIAQPALKFADAAKIVPGGEIALEQIQASLLPQQLDLASLVTLYKDHSFVSPARFALKSVYAALQSFDSNVISQTIETWKKYGIDLASIIKELESTKANTSYEQLENVGLDYNLEQFVASFRIKRPGGYSGDLCHGGSMEYVAFWADWNNDCKWEYIGTTAVNVHDINNITADGLSYAAILPYDFTHKHKHCYNPYVVKIRAVLSWNVAPSATDPNKLEYWGNLMDKYVQVKPGEQIPVGSVIPYFYVLGGIPVDKISNGTGLTTSGAAFALNANPVESGAPFAGIVVIQGPSYPGYYYRIKVTNLITSAFYYLTDSLWLVGYHQFPLPPHNTYKTIVPDAGHYYAYQSKGLDFDDNIDNVLARWTPGGNDKWQIDLDILGIPGVFSKVIQMDNTAPVAILNIDNSGDCTHFHIGDTITGHYTATDDYISSYALSASFVGLVASGNVNTINTPFSFATSLTGSPCGSINLTVYEKTIHDSVSIGYYS